MKKNANYASSSTPKKNYKEIFVVLNICMSLPTNYNKYLLMNFPLTHTMPRSDDTNN